MSAAIQRLFESIPSAASIEDFGSVVDTIREVYGLTHVVYHAVSLGTGFAEAKSGAGRLKGDAGVWRIGDGSLVTLTYSDEWINRYLEANYVRIDPVVAASMGAFHPVDWKSLDWSARKTQEFLREAIRHGVGNQGLTLPIRGPDGQFALFTVNKNCDDRDWEIFKQKYTSDLLIISHYYHQKIIDVMRLTPLQKTFLSARETDVLRALALGKNRAQIAHDLGVSENTIRVYIDSARHKLGAFNTSHAIAVSVSKGILSI